MIIYSSKHENSVNNEKVKAGYSSEILAQRGASTASSGTGSVCVYVEQDHLGTETFANSTTRRYVKINQSEFGATGCTKDKTAPVW